MDNNVILFFIIIALASLLFLPLFTVNQDKQPLLLSNSLSIRQTIEQVKEQYESDLLRINGVVGVGISEYEDKPCIKVYLENESLNVQKQIPKQLNGFKVDTQVTGSIQAQPK
ncbi:hypothetical protein [Nostoc sp. UIC 10630]|uniref:hypothetical protein n=1 Tax=Nostoc sp. UIC 10630 TaxID=2100146 RepID=UPI001931E1C2|nr:hypothetical protein [Nostoc sp. UIC 10630]